jgi:hypothetical protein
MSEQRNTSRVDICVDVKITDAEGHTRTVKSRDVSSTGLFLTVDSPLPAIGSFIDVQVTSMLGDGEEPPTNQAKVVRHADMGIGLQFLFDD